MKKPVCLLLLFIPFCFLEAEQRLTLQVSTMPEAKLNFTQSFVFPFLQGEGPLTGGNNVALALGAEVSPVSVNGLAEAVWTPVAFFQLSAGGRLGSGWKLTFFGDELYGIGKSYDSGGGALGSEGSAFDGLIWKTQAGAALQFDAAAIWPGTAGGSPDWHHIVARTYHELNYKAYTAASGDESWYYEHDLGDNVNGANWYGNFLAGYQMPIVLNTVALLAEADLCLRDIPGRSAWGDDKIRWTFSALFNFTVTEKISAALALQTRTRRNGVDPHYTARRDRYVRSLSIDRDDPLRLEFYRAAVILSYVL